MTDKGGLNPSRRTALRGLGVAVALGIAGCLGDSTDDAGSEPGSGDGDSGPDDEPEAANEYGYDTHGSSGVEVPLVPVTDAVEWYDDEDTVFVDARNQEAYEAARIEGAVFSPAPDGLPEDDPVTEQSTDTRIVTYCVCPHTLATARGATLIQDGYVHTYALDEGLEPWLQAGHPAEGEEIVYGIPDAMR